MVEVAAWLAEFGLGHLAETFRENGIAPDVLGDLNDADLKELGLNLGDRKRLLKALASLAATAAMPGPSIAVAREAERRQLTVMIVDMVGSTALAARLDPEEMREILRGYQNTVAGEITRFEGQVAKLMGDGVLAYFGWPRAHEDEAERAVRAGMAVTRAVAQLQAPGGQSLACRIGIATGLVVVGDLVGEGAAQEEAVVGETPNLAARLQALADPGAVVIADSTRRLAGDLFEFADLGQQTLKGMADPVAAFAIIGERSPTSRFEARSGPSLLPMVGRDQELALLIERWESAKAGEGQAVLLVGEAGIGKSRISEALIDKLAKEPHTRIRYHCSPYHVDSAFWPVIQQLHRAAGLAPAQSTEEKLDRLEALLGQALAVSVTVAPFFAALLGLGGEERYGRLELSPQIQRNRTLAALRDQLLGLAGHQPVLMLLEDAHWIDPTTLELIELCLERIARASVLMLLTSRPENEPSLAAYAHVTRLTLNRLGRSGVEAIVARLGGGGRLPPEVIDTIIARADGVPLFVEELTKAILETGQTSVPASLQDSLMSRVDRLLDVKEVVQVAACIGREFDYSLLAKIAGTPESDLIGALDKLTRAGILFRHGTPPDARFTFKHSLVRDVAYESQLKRKRRDVHTRIGRALETSYPHIVEALPELIAHHWAEAGRASEAAAYRRRAGERALARSATVEAVAQLTAGLDVVSSIPDERNRQREELDLQVALGAALFSAKGQAAVETTRAYGRARELCRLLGEERRLVPVLFGLWASHNTRGDLDAAYEVATDLLKLADQSGDHAAQLTGLRASGTTLLFFGRLDEARTNLEKLLALDPSMDGPLSASLFPTDLRVTGRVFLAWTTLLLGHVEAARQHAEQALAEARQLAHRPTLALVLQCRCILALLLDQQDVGERIEALLAAAAEQGFAFWSAAGHSFRGWALAMGGDVAAGIALIREGIAAQRATEATLFTSYCLALLADAQAAAGNPREALDLLAQALDESPTTGGRWLEAELHRRKAEMLQASGGEPAEVEAHLLRALAVAREQRAKLWELRAVTSLARLWAAQGDQQKARDLLAPVHGWFTDGLDTPDLVEARLVLEAVA